MSNDQAVTFQSKLTSIPVSELLSMSNDPPITFQSKLTFDDSLSEKKKQDMTDCLSDTGMQILK